MSPFALFVRAIVTALTKHGRHADLVLGLAAVGLGAYWQNSWMMIGGFAGVVSYAADVNARVQRVTMNWLGGYVSKSRATR